MFGIHKKNDTATLLRRNRTFEVGYISLAEQASFMWDDPRPFRRPDNQEPKHAKALQNCPAVVEYEARHFVVTCPIDLNIALAKDKEGRLGVRDLDGQQSAIGSKQLSKMLTVNGPSQWRHPNRPLIQLQTPYYFIADEVCWMNQVPPYLTYRDPPWPGIMVGGRLPIHIWPRPMIWAFEWHDQSKPLQLKRGEPWFLLRFETNDPRRHIRLVEAERTPELDQFIKGADAVSNFQRRTWSLFKIAARRRPKKLVKKVNRGRPTFDSETDSDF